MTSFFKTETTEPKDDQDHIDNNGNNHSNHQIENHTKEVATDYHDLLNDDEDEVMLNLDF